MYLKIINIKRKLKRPWSVGVDSNPIRTQIQLHPKIIRSFEVWHLTQCSSLRVPNLNLDWHRDNIWQFYTDGSSQRPILTRHVKGEALYLLVDVNCQPNGTSRSIEHRCFENFRALCKIFILRLIYNKLLILFLINFFIYELVKLSKNIQRIEIYIKYSTKLKIGEIFNYTIITTYAMLNI